MDQEDDDQELVQYQEALHNLEQQRDAVSFACAAARCCCSNSLVASAAATALWLEWLALRL